MLSIRRHNRNMARPRQRGAVLYIALIMLVLISLLGIVAMQVSGLQEKMASNYRSVNLAFQNAEGRASTAECYLDNQVNRRSSAGCMPGSINIEEICDSGFDATNWAKTMSMATTAAVSTNMRSIGKCISGQASLGMGRAAERGGDPNPVYQITVYATDTPASPSADAAIDTIFMP